MKLINSSVKILPQSDGLDGVYKQIEIAGRTAYKSEDKITEDSAKKFVDMLINRGHTAPLEHGTIYLIVRLGTPLTDLSYISDSDVIRRYKSNPYSRVVERKASDGYTWAYITTNARVIYENDWQSDLEYISLPSIHHIKRMTARFICSRSISHELVRHRVFSFVQESTRYCNYGKDKFDNELTFIKPTWVDIPLGEYTDLQYEGDFDLTTVLIDKVCYNFRKISVKEENIIDPKYFNFIQPLYYAEGNYLVGLERGFKPQEMREVLPNALKTEVVMTGFEDDWKGFFKLRCDSAAHPDMQKLANELKEKLWSTIY